MKQSVLDKKLVHPVFGGTCVSPYSGNVEAFHFAALIRLSKISSDKVIHDLEDYFVFGHKRKVVCEAYGVSQGCFSLKVRQLQQTNQLVWGVQRFYTKKVTEVRSFL